MSFDMYLFGEIDVFDTEPGGLFALTYTLALWQKHYGLHRFICGRFGEGVNQQDADIYLSEEDLLDLLACVKSGRLVYDRNLMGVDEYTSEHDIRSLEFALDWLRTEPRIDRNVLYSAD